MFESQQEHAEDTSTEFKIIDCKQAYKRYIKVFNRTIDFPNGKRIDYDIVGHNLEHQFITCMIYHTTTKTLTLISEYMQGGNTLKYGFASGGYEKEKHLDIKDCVRQEVLEETGYGDGQLVSLLNNTKGIMENKWCTNTFFPFLLIDPIRVHQGKLDYEEFITVRDEISLDEMDNLIMNGEVALPTVQNYFMGKKYLIDNKIYFK